MKLVKNENQLRNFEVEKFKTKNWNSDGYYFLQKHELNRDILCDVDRDELNYPWMKCFHPLMKYL